MSLEAGFAELLSIVPMRGVVHVPMYDDPELVARTVLQVPSAKSTPSDVQPPTTGGRLSVVVESTVDRGRETATNAPSGPHQEVHR